MLYHWGSESAPEIQQTDRHRGGVRERERGDRERERERGGGERERETETDGQTDQNKIPFYLLQLRYDEIHKG